MAPLLAVLSMAPDEVDLRIRKARDRVAGARDRKSRVEALTELAMFLSHRYMRHTGLRADLDESIGHLRDAISLARTQPGPRARAERLLSAVLCARHRPGDLQEVITLVGRLLAQQGVDVRQNGPLLSHLGMALLAESQLTTDSAKLDEGITMLEKAIERMPASRTPAGRAHADMIRYVLALALAGRYALHWSADRADLTKATELISAVDEDELGRLVPGFTEFKEQVEHGLGIVMSAMTGERLEVMPAPETHRTTPDGFLGRQFVRLGATTSTLTSTEAYRVGDLRSVDEQIESLREELAGLSPDDYLRRSTLILLAQLHCTRFRNRQLAGMADARTDLDAAQQYARTAFESSAPGSIGAAAGVLGSCLLDRFALGLGDRADLDEAVRLMRTAMTHYAEHSRSALAICCSLGEVLMLRGSLEGGSFDDIEEAERLLVTLAERQPANSPLAPVAKVRLAVLLQYRSALTADTEDRLRASLVSRRSVETAADAGVLWAYDAAASWARWAWHCGDTRDRAEAHQLAVQCLSRMTRAQLGRDYAELALRRVSADLVTRAAFTLSAAGTPREAVVTTETGRGILLSAALERDGVQLDETIPADLRRRFREARDRLRAAEAAVREFTDDRLDVAPDRTAGI
ncbi:hypothetical protein [Amycolatopsis sp. DG1A-15b]|uniref:hypothetical protein n=1 Tax=Amycolatopsis sp. DG1A-15b TaxID=3052846 RepID=UPI00255B6E67|nr:hypothetical protein [Amycolatopsis sp. DG1A-15b]WIX92528.1 hypothetical protein QRY02_19645 [Amycolatopsis sp. DG1A-15b]